MKNIKKIAAAAAAVAIVTGGVVFANTGYSSSSDPLVTLSYVNSTLKSQIVEEVLRELAITTPGTAETSSTAFEVIEVKKGETLMSTGSCEIILRSGTAEAIITSEVNITNNIGLSDLTAGTEITNGKQIKTNDYIIIPRGDGRGALVTSDNAYFMVRGEYEIVK